MNYKQNEKINQVKESTLVVGIDIGSTTQYARAFDWRGIELGKVFTFSNSREGFESFKGFKTFSAVAECKDFPKFNASPVKCSGVLCRTSDIDSNYQS